MDKMTELNIEEKLQLLNKWKARINPFNLIVLEAVNASFNHPSGLKQHDIKWIVDMIDAIEPIDNFGTKQGK